MESKVKVRLGWEHAAGMLAIVALCFSCHQHKDVAQGVKLVFDEAAISPSSSFELRFDEEVVAQSEVGQPARVSPLIISPPVEGNFVWLSRRSGLFTPTQALALATSYLITLRTGLTNNHGAPLAARLHRQVRTPEFGITESSPRIGDQANCPAGPVAQIEFNAEVSASAAASYGEFRSSKGERVRALIRQATTNDVFDHWGSHDGLTWRERFVAAPKGASAEASDSSTNEFIRNRLVIEPAQLLPPGTNWMLVLHAGLPCSEYPTALPQKFELPLGRVWPFELTRAQAHNTAGGGRTIRLQFSKELGSQVTESNFTEWINLSPTPTNLSVEPWGSGVTLSGNFELHRGYRFLLDKSLPAVDGLMLPRDFAQTFVFEPIPPRLYFPAFETAQLSAGQRQIDLLAINVPEVRVRAKLLDRHNLIHALRGYNSYFRRNFGERDFDEPYREVDFNVVPGETVFDQRFRRPAEIDQAEKIPLRWESIMPDHAKGALFIVAEEVTDKYNRRGNLGTECLVQVTDLGLLWKHFGDTAQVLVFSHRTAAPVSNAVVRLLTDDNKSLAESRTDASGLATLHIGEHAKWIMVQAGDDLHAMPLQQNVWLYGFHLPIEWNPEPERRKALLFTDRPVYRPGETAHCKAIVRDWTGDSFRVLAGVSGRLQCVDARGDVCLDTNLTLSALGSLDYSIPLPQNVRGEYRLDLQVGERHFEQQFHVQGYQPNAFELNFSGKLAYGPDEKIELPLVAKYYMGKNLSRAKVRWSLDAWNRPFVPEGFDEFVFAGERAPDRPDNSSLSLQGNLAYAGQTNFVIAPDVPIDPEMPQPRAVDLLAEVIDLNQQTISKRVHFVRHSSQFYLGLRRYEASLAAGTPIPLTLVAVRTDGSPLPPVTAHVEIEKVDVRSVPRQGAGRAVTYEDESTVTKVAELDATTIVPQKRGTAWEFDGPSSKESAKIVLTNGGNYLITATSRDDRGHEVKTGFSIYVQDALPRSWEYHNEARLDLVADRKSYTIGDTAVLLAKAPFSGTALVTVEREKVLRSFVTNLDGSAPEIRVPLQPEDAPNVFVSVALLRGSDASKKRFARPESRIGYCQLLVEKPETKLVVSVHADHSEYRPAEYVNVIGEVRDWQSKPVADAEVTLYAVDEGVLSLTGYTAPNAHAFFYAPRRLAVRSGSSLSHLMPENPEELGFHNKGYLIGGGGRGERLRKNFLGCAFWQASLQTDEKGRVKASFMAPDSLTRYRIIAVVHTARNQFGTGESSFEINKPLMIEPALPRFANVSDQINARAVVHNEADSGSEIEVSLQLDDKAVITGSMSATQTITLAAHGSQAIEFPLRFENPGTAKWAWKARSNGSTPFADAVQSSLEVGYVTPLLREIYVARSEATETNLLERANPQLLEGKGEITVTVCNSRLGQLGEAISQLLHYPYGCVEQTSSSLLPWIVLREVPSVSPCLRGTARESKNAVRQGVDRLISMQTAEGGLGYWPGAREPMLWGSAYGAMVLTLAKRHGFDVPAKPLDRLLNYLSEQIRSDSKSSVGWSSDYGPSDRCLAVYALALAGKPEPAYHELLFNKARELANDSRLLLALAILESKGPRKMIEQLLRSPATREPDYWFGCAARTGALQLLARVLADPRDPSIDVLVEELMRDRMRGHWWTTQGNAWALYALTEYGSRVEKAVRHAEGTMTWTGQSYPFTLEKETRTFEKTFASASSSLAPLALANPEKQLLFTQVKLETRPTAIGQSRQDRGFRIDRTYARLDDEGKAQPLTNLHVGDRVLITLTVEVRKPATYVAIDDALPSIFEAINPNFKSQETAEKPHIDFYCDFRELRADRALFFRNHLDPGLYVIRYLARVRASGVVTAPPAKIEEMYHPEHFGLSETIKVASAAME